jgi:signal transduction histidine kinase
MLSQALEMVNDLVGARASSIHLVEVHPHSGQPCLMLVAQSGATPEAVELVKFLPMDHGLPAHVLNSGEAIITTDAIQDARTFSPQAFQSVGSSAYIGVPVRASRQALGVLSISKPTGEAVTEDDARLLMGVAEQIGAAVQMVRLSKQAEQAAVIEERQRLARDLHDSVTQALYGLELFAAAGLNQAEAEGQAIYQHHFSRVRSIAQYALREMRLLIHELRPPVLEQVGLVAALQQRLDAVEGRSGVSTRLLVDGEIHLPPRLETALYRIAQEALNNALKHSRAKTITVRLEIQNEELLLEVEDDGIGFISEQASSLGGMGLISMQERAGAIGAEFGTVSLPGKGTRVIVRVKYE